MSLAVSINLLLYGFLGPFAAALMDRFGARYVALGALSLLAIGVGLTTQMHAPWQLYLLWGLVVGTGAGAVAGVLGAWISNRWFDKRRGLVLGMLTASSATGQLVFLPGLARLVVTSGWRTAALVVMAAALVAIPLVAIFMRNDPRDVGLRPFGAPTDGPEPPPPPRRADRRHVRRAPHGAALAGFLAAGRHVLHLRREHQRADRDAPDPRVHGRRHPRGHRRGPARRDRRLRHVRHDDLGMAVRPLEQPLPAVLVLRPAGAVARVPAGRVRRAAPVPAVRADSFGPSVVGLAVFAVFYGLDWVATVPPTVRLTADLFGRENAALMYGWIFAAHQLGAATAAYGAGRSTRGSAGYQMAFTGSGLLCLLAAGLALRIGHPTARPAAPPRPVEAPGPRVAQRPVAVTPRPAAPSPPPAHPSRASAPASAELCGGAAPSAAPPRRAAASA